RRSCASNSAREPAVMFTGIVEETGRVRRFSAEAEGWSLVVRAQRVLEGTRAGDSISVNGCCLTAVEAGPYELRFDVLEETRRLTNFAGLGSGAAVNLERSLRYDGRVGGHFVTGHIDGLGRVETFERRGADTYLRVVAPEGSGRHLVAKGSVAVDGVSLTVAETSGDIFAVWLIPTTMRATCLGERRVGDAVNLEFDLLGKYIEKLTPILSG
ncbi:MAG: riboflavin synthase, partial [Opitutaceae bacterium]